MNQPFSGGWRFTSNDALANLPMGGGLLGNRVTPEFLKQVAGMGSQPSALQQATQPKALDSVLAAEERGAGDAGLLGQQSSGGKTFGVNAAGNMVEMEPSGFSVGFNPSAKSALGFMSGGPLGAFMSSLSMQRTAPVETIVAPGLNGYFDNNYGASSTLQGPPTSAQAQALAELLARDLGGNDGGGYGGYGGSTGGSDTMGFGGVY